MRYDRGVVGRTRRASTAFVFALASGCATISGLDSLEVGDGSTVVLDATNDATFDASDDVAMTNDAPSDANGPDVLADASTDAHDASADVVTAGKIVCGNTTCTISNQTFCCVDSNSPVCEQATGSCEGATDTILSCDDDTDCTGGKVCCLETDLAYCVPSCTAVHLCVPNVSTYCTCKPYSIGSKENIGACP